MNKFEEMVLTTFADVIAAGGNPASRYEVFGDGGAVGNQNAAVGELIRAGLMELAGATDAHGGTRYALTATGWRHLKRSAPRPKGAPKAVPALNGQRKRKAG